MSNDKVPPQPRGMFDEPQQQKTEQPQQKKSTVTKKEAEEANVAGMQKIPEKKPDVKKQEPPQSNKKTSTKITPNNPNAPAKNQTAEEIRALRIKRMSITQLVSEAPEKRFVDALTGGSGNEQEVAKAKKVFNSEKSFAMEIFRKNDYLRHCAENDKEAVIDAMVNVALSGLTLNPTLKLAYLVPFQKKVLFWASYMGKREIVTRSGQVKDAYARLVYEGEEFDIKFGSGAYLKHTPDPFGKKDPNKIKGGYWMCILRDGTEKFDTMSKDDIEAIKARSAAVQSGKGSPWDTDYEQMALKTIFNRGFKEMPKSGLSEAQLQAMEIEGRLEEELHEKWVKTSKVKQDNFDEDFQEPEDAKIVD